MLLKFRNLSLLMGIITIVLTTAMVEAVADNTESSPIKVPAPLVSPAEKQAAGNAANKVSPHDPDLQETLPKELAGKATLALALGGGGVHGAAHIGVLKVLNEANINVDSIVGSSMGAIIGGLYSAGVPLNEIERLLTDKSLRKAYIPSPILGRILSLPFVKIFHPFRKTYAGIWTGNKLQKFLEHAIPADKQNFDQLDRSFYAVAVNLLDGKAYSIHSGSLASAIHASAAMAPLLSPTMIDGKLYIDGGVRANLPAYAARQTGASVVCAVNVDTPLQSVPARQFRKFRRVGSRITDIFMALNDEHQLQFADIIISPDISNIRVFSNKPGDVEWAEKAGELAARRALPEIIKLLKEKSASASVEPCLP